MKISRPVTAFAVFQGKDTTATAPGLLTPTGAGLGIPLISKADLDFNSAVQLLQVVNLSTGAEVSNDFVIATFTKDATSLGISTPQIFQVQGVNHSGQTLMATFGVAGDA